MLPSTKGCTNGEKLESKQGHADKNKRILMCHDTDNAM